MEKIGSHAGHAKVGSGGAVGAVSILLNESSENRLVNAEIIRLLKENGITAYDNTVDVGTQNEILNKIVSNCNSRATDLELSIHFNAGANDLTGNEKTTGVECYVYNIASPTAKIAERINEKIAAFGFKNRGVKNGSGLAFLKGVKTPAILIEVCFVDDKDDADLYKKVGYKAIAKAIVEGVLNKTIQTEPEQAANNTLYKVQVGAFSVKANADKLANELKTKGYNCTVVKG